MSDKIIEIDTTSDPVEVTLPPLSKDEIRLKVKGKALILHSDKETLIIGSENEEDNS